MTINVTGVNDPPSVANDAYTTVGNTELVAAGATLTSLARVIDATNPLANDMDGEEMSALSVSALGADTTAPFTGTSTLGGNVTINANGSFTYVPPIGVKNRLDNTGSGGTDDRDSFVYTATDGTATANASVFISIINELLWYVHNDPAGEALNPAGGDGRSNDPFDLLNDNVDDAPDDDAQEASGDSEHIFVFEGDTTTTGQNLGISLKDGQKLIGHNATTLLVGGVTITLPTPGGRPKITNSLPAVMADASTSDRTGVEIRNLDLAGGGATGSNSNAIDVTAAGANNVEVTIDNCFIRDAADEGIDLNPNGSGTFTATVTNNEYATSSPAGNAFDLTTTMATTGQVELDFSNNTNITSGNGDGVNVNASTIGTGGIVFITNFANNQVHGNTGGIGICMDTVTFDTTPASSVFQTVSGGDTDVGTIGNAVGASGIVLDDVSGDLSFTDLDIFNLNGDGLFIDGTDPLSPAMNPISGFGFATGAGSTIDSLGFFFGGAGADLNDLTITASGATFASISSDGDQTVALDTVSGGTFEVTGMTTSVNSADDGIDFNDTTATVTFSGPVSITDTFDDGIDIDNSFDTTITFSDTVTITGAGDDGVSLNGANSGTPTGSVSFNGLLDIDNSGFAGIFAFDNLGTLNFVTVDIDTVGVGGVIFDGAVLAGTATFTQLDVNAGAGSQVGLGFADGTTGTVDVNGGTIENVEGEVIGLIESNVTFTYTGTVTQANASVPLILVDDDDTSTVTFESGSSLSDTAGVGIQLFNADGSYTFDGPVSVSGNDDDGIDIGTDSLGMATFNGSVTLNTGAGTAVDHGAATLSFTGGLDIDTSTGIGFLSTGGMANVTGTGNTIDISGGAAAVVVDTSSLNLNNTAVTTAGGDTVNTSDSTLSGMGNTTAALLSCNDGGGNTGNIPFNGGVDTCP